jgi:hypothetical protein
MSTDKYMVHIPDSNHSESQSESMAKIKAINANLMAKIKAINDDPHLDPEERRILVRDLVIERRTVT